MLHMIPGKMGSSPSPQPAENRCSMKGIISLLLEESLRLSKRTASVDKEGRTASLCNVISTVSFEEGFEYLETSDSFCNPYGNLSPDVTRVRDS